MTRIQCLHIPRAAVAAIILVAVIGLQSCERTFETPPIQVIPDMDNQRKVKAQAESEFFWDGVGSRLPVPGTMSQSGPGYRYYGQPELAVANLKNPLTLSEAVLAQGRDKFQTFCAVCHGLDASGNGLVVDHGFPPPPTLYSKKIHDYPDAMIFHIISNGQNAMPSYARQIAPEDRWATIMYLRVLLRSRKAAIADLPADKRKGPVQQPAAKPAEGAK
jgi:mono/diheme cytochrome c family protein